MLLATGVSLYTYTYWATLPDKLIDDEVTLSLIALLPVFLSGALAKDEQQQTVQIEATIAAIKQNVLTFPPHIQHELLDLFKLLSSQVATLALTGHLTTLAELPLAFRAHLITAWRDSYFSLLNQAYDGLKELIFASFYGNPVSWDFIHYNKPVI